MPFTAAGADASYAVLSATHEPFGPPNKLQFNALDTDTIGYDLDYRNTGIVSNTHTYQENLAYGYDYANNLHTITDTINTANTQTLGYDVINRLNSAVSGSGGYGTLGWTYDKSGNRLTQTGSAITYTYTPNSNKLATINAGTSQTVTTNADGNITSLPPGTSGGTPTTATYSAANRLATTTPATGSGGSYVYDAFGRRFQKTVGTNVWHYTYDQWNHLLEEAPVGGTTSDYIYMDGQEVANWNPTLGHIYFAHTDRIGTPVALTDVSDNTVWKVTWQPFGNYQTYYAPAVTNSLGFPGQYYDGETGWHYNVMRDYQLGLGRYVESDPIGLGGGLNTYGYVNGNPLTRIDPDGLDPLTTQQGQQVANTAAQWIGTPYALGGTTTAGADCSGSTWAIYNQAGFPYSPSDVQTSQFVQRLTSGTTPTPGKFYQVTTPQAGDVMYWQGHLAIYDSNATTTCGCQGKGNPNMFSATKPGGHSIRPIR